VCTEDSRRTYTRRTNCVTLQSLIYTEVHDTNTMNHFTSQTPYHEVEYDRSLTYVLQRAHTTTIYAAIELERQWQKFKAIHSLCFLLRFQICCLQDSGNFPIASTIHREHQLTCQNFQTPGTKLDCYHGHLIRLHVTTSCTFSMHTRILAFQARRYLRWQEVVTSRTADLGLRYHLGIDLDKDYWLMRVGERR
jgi:hypothetical protein